MGTRWAVPRLWPGETVAVAANGPSLCRDDLDKIRGRAALIVVNDAFRLARWADLLYACDNAWWDCHAAEALAFAGLRVGLKDEIAYAGVLVPRRLKRRDTRDRLVDQKSPWSTDPECLATGGNAGYQAVNLALLAGAARILLVGFDMRTVDGRRHWFGDHPAGLNNPNARNFADWIAAFEASPAPAGTEIVNCTPGSALRCYPMMDLEAALGRETIRDVA